MTPPHARNPTGAAIFFAEISSAKTRPKAPGRKTRQADMPPLRVPILADARRSINVT